MKSVGPIADRLNSAADWVKPEEWRCCSHHQSNVEADSTGTKRTIINSSVQECFLWPRLQRQTHNQAEFVYCQSDVRQNQSEPRATGRKVDSKFKSRFGDFNQTIRSTQRFSRGYLCLFVGWFVTGRVWMDPEWIPLMFGVGPDEANIPPALDPLNLPLTEALTYVHWLISGCLASRLRQPRPSEREACSSLCVRVHRV